MISTTTKNAVIGLAALGFGCGFSGCTHSDSFLDAMPEGATQRYIDLARTASTAPTCAGLLSAIDNDRRQQKFNPNVQPVNWTLKEKELLGLLDACGANVPASLRTT
jgi:hypothetical protein